MSAALVVATADRSEIPPDVRRKIALFLAAGLTGQIVLDIKEGRILGYRMTECGRVPRSPLDIDTDSAQDLDL